MSKVEKELEQRLKFSEQKRTRLRTRLTQELSSENTFVWSVVDLMTLLLIFFIFLCSQNHASFFSGSAPNVRMAVSKKPFQQQTISPKTAPQKQEISEDSREIIRRLTTDSFEMPEKKKTNSASEAENRNENVPVNESMAQLKKEAMAVIEGDDQETFSLRWNDQRLIFVLGERIIFPVGQAKLLSDSAPLLERIARVIASKNDFDVLVSGHTDDTPIDTYQFRSNWELSAARAISVARFLCRNGVDPHRLSIQGYAEFRPMFPNSTPENKQANRRVEITLVKQKPLEPERSYDPNPVR